MQDRQPEWNYSPSKSYSKITARAIICCIKENGTLQDGSEWDSNSTEWKSWGGEIE